MRYLYRFLGFLLFLMVVGFAVKNSEVVTVYYYLGYQWQAPLVLVLLLFFVVGAVVGVLASLGYLFRQRKEILGLKRELRQRAAHTEADNKGEGKLPA